MRILGGIEAMKRCTQSTLVLALVALLAACAGGDGDRLDITAMDMGPHQSIPATISSTIILHGHRFDDGGPLRALIGGSQTLPCVVASGNTATCVIPAGMLAGGTYSVQLYNDVRMSPLYDGMLVVDPQPTLASSSVTTFDTRFNVPFALTGSGFIAPVTVTFRDGAATPLQSAINAVVTLNGTEIQAESPMLPGVTDPAATIQILNGDGQVAVAPLAVVLSEAVVGDRTIDGTQNHVISTAWGSADIHLRRHVAPDYADGLSAPAGGARPSAREVSNTVCAQAGPTQNAIGATDMFWLWGQFVDHDIDLTPGASPAEPFNIAVPSGDVHFDPAPATGTETIGLDRSVYDLLTGTSNARQQLNKITSWIDASNVYGSDATRATFLRENDGTGRLKTSTGNLLPFNDGTFDNAGGNGTNLFLAGDIRCNEQVSLTAMHTLFMREHNRLADAIRTKNPHLTGDQVYEAARLRVTAEMQFITFNEFLPLLLGPMAPGPYNGYAPTSAPDIANVFSTACYRFGHSMVASQILRLDATLNPIPEGNLQLRDAFFRPDRLSNEGGIDPVLRGIVTQIAQALDVQIVDDLRNFLFGPPGAGGFDLAALNIQRGRDHGLADYNSVRAAFGLGTQTTFAGITTDVTLQTNLAALYGTVDNIDPWVGGLAEDHLTGALVGEVLATVLKDQFERLRSSDRFWYENVFSGAALAEIESTTLAGVIRANTGIGSEIQDNVMVVAVP